MKRIIFGLTIGSSWGNGHATLGRGNEHDASHCAQQRDCAVAGGAELVSYDDFHSSVHWQARRELHAPGLERVPRNEYIGALDGYRTAMRTLARPRPARTATAPNLSPTGAIP